MSVYVKFSTLLIQSNPQIQLDKLHTFKLQIYSKQFNENFSWYSDGHQYGSIDLPSNLFIIPISSALFVNVSQYLQGEPQNDGFKVQCSSKIDFMKAQLENQPNFIKKDSIQLKTINKAFKFIIKYNFLYKANKIFVGNICLDRQGHYQSKFASATKQILKQKKSNQEHMSQNVIDADQTPISGFSRQLKYIHNRQKEALVECSEKEIQMERRNEQQLTKNDKLTLSYDQLQEIAEEQTPVNTLSNYTLATNGENWKKLQSTRQTLVKELKNVRSLYKGPCKSRNIFSCLDPQVEDQTQLCLIEPIYR